ncbi:class III extradiol dioxygenase subunit B-like domain-containing protein [Streptomyces sp. NPDC005438]|uniref:class III extradiol dioxygenase subunit B-like domain-containing protein n=1 Tax=Streptomyces sp. NPDC005438 TaxID=3156880 RepID=UPI0033A1A4C4
MLVAAAVCPCPPLLVPEVAAGAAGELDELRRACRDALRTVAEARPDQLWVVGPARGSEPGPYPTGSTGSFAGFGVDLDVRLGALSESPRRTAPLPASLSVGAWLLSEAGWSGAPPQGYALDPGLTPERCAALGREWGDPSPEAPRVGLLVMGDGSSCRSLKAPGYLDDRAADFDARVAEALATVDLGELEALSPDLAAELGCVGRAGWQVLAAAARQAPPLRGRLRHDEAPYGVGYLVADWRLS